MGDFPDHFKTQELCVKALEVDPRMLGHVPDHFKTQEMCDKTVKDEPYSLQYVPVWFVTQQQMKLCHDNNRPIRWWYHDDKMIEWYDSHKKTKGSKSLN